MTISTDVNGSVRPCCRYKQPKRQYEYRTPWMKNGDLNYVWNSNEMQSIRKAFLDGKEPEECKWCWDEEHAGVVSFRQTYNNRLYDIKTDSTIADPPKIYDLKLSNVCNLKCRMCSPQASSLIAKEENIDNPYLYSEKIIGTPNEDIFFNEWLPYMQELELTGGEPFFSSENKILLQKISKTEYAKNIRVLITTNGMFYDKKLLESLTHFKIVNFSFSIDDVGERLEYQRYGSDWKKIQNNLLNIKNNYQNFRVYIYRTVNIFNIWHLEDLDQFCIDNNIKIGDGLLHEPEEFCIQNVPDYIKDMIKEKYKYSTRYNDIINFLDLHGNSNPIRMFNSLQKKDRIRNQSFSEVYPEWSDLLMYIEDLTYE